MKATTTKTADDWGVEGKSLADRGRYSEALDAYNNALSIDPNDAWTWGAKAFAFINLGRYQEALDACNRALAIAPNNAWTWDYKGVALYNLGRYQEALDAYNQALSIDPGSTYIQNNKNIVLNKIAATNAVSLNVSSSPSGASVYVDGFYQGTTPTTPPTPTPTTVPPTPVPTIPPPGDFNLFLPIIVILVVLLLAGGGYGIYWMKRKSSGDQTPVIVVKKPGREQPPPTAPSSGAGDLLNQIASVEQKASALSQFKSPVQALLTKARDQYRSSAYDAVWATLKSAETAITSLAPCETRLAQWKTEGYTTTSLESLKTDNINTIITAFRNYEQDLVTLKQHERRVQELKRSCSMENIDPVISQRIASIESQLHDPCNILDTGREIDSIEQQMLRDRQERAKQQQDTEQLFTRLHTKAEKLTRYAPLTTGPFAEAQNQIAAGRYDNAQKILRGIEDPIDALLECESLLALWKVKGYTLTELEGLHTLNPDEVLPVFQKSKQNINRLEAITQELESKKISCPNLREQPETASVVLSIEQNLKNPALIETVEKDYQQLIDVVCQLENKQKIIEQNLRDQVEKVRGETGSPGLKQEIAPIMKSIQQHDIPHAKELLRTLAEQQLSRVNVALSTLGTDGSVDALSSGSIGEQIAAENYGDAISDSEKVIVKITQILEDKQKLIEQNLRDQVEKVLGETGSPGLKQETAPIMKSIRQHDIPRAKEMLRTLAEQQLSRANAALLTLGTALGTDGSVDALSSDSIGEQIAAENYGDAIIDSEKVIVKITQILEDKQKLIEQNLRDQVEKVLGETGSPVLKQETAPIMKSIQQHDIPRAKEMLRTLAEQQLSQANAALLTLGTALGTDGSVDAFSSDSIGEQIAAENYGDAIIDSEKVIVKITQILEDKQKRIEQNLRDQVEKVLGETGSPGLKQEIAPIMESIQQHDIPRAKEMLRTLAEQQLSQANAALLTLGTDGSVDALSSDSIGEQIAAENYGDAIIDSEKVIVKITQILEDKQKHIEQNLRDQVEKVLGETGSPSLKREIAPIMKSIRLHDIPRAKEMLMTIAEQQLSRANTALLTLRTDGAVVSLSSDSIREQIAAQHYGDAILDSEQAISELTRIQEMYAKAKVLRLTDTEPAILALFEKGKYEEFIRVCSEWQERRKTVIELKERATASFKNAVKFGRVPEGIQENLASEKISLIESAIKDLDAFAASAKPMLTLALDYTRLVADKWHKVRVHITNNGDAHAFDVSFSFSSEFETRWIKPTNVEAGMSSTVEIGILPKKEGSIPLEITVHCLDGHDKPYDRTHEFWIDVVDRMSLTPEKDASATPPQGPVSQFIPKPLTPKQLPPDLSDRYTESEFIGKGGFARVFKAKRKDGKYVAVKIPISLDESTGRSFIAEMQNWTKLDHPNIVRVFDFNIMPMPYFEMEICDSSLAERKKPIESEEAAWILFNVCEGLKFTHARKIIHRDLKPQNILLKNGVPKISDWGLSRVITESTSTTAASFTPYYAAPEQISSEHKDERTDIWQLGVIFYELVAGQLPFTGDSMVAVMAAIAAKNPQPPSAINTSSHDVEVLIMKCLEKNPNKRYQSVLEFQKDLALYLRVTYTESLKTSVTAKDYTSSAFYCGDLVVVNLLTGDMKSAYKYLLDLVHYSKGDVKVEAQELSEQIKMRMEMGVTEIPDELIQKAEIIVHKVSLRFRK